MNVSIFLSWWEKCSHACTYVWWPTSTMCNQWSLLYNVSNTRKNVCKVVDLVARLLKLCIQSHLQYYIVGMCALNLRCIKYLFSFKIWVIFQCSNISSNEWYWKLKQLFNDSTTCCKQYLTSKNSIDHILLFQLFLKITYPYSLHGRCDLLEIPV